MSYPKTSCLFLSALCIALALPSCQKEEGTSYQDVKHIISTSCAVSGCHDPITNRENIDCTNYARMAGASGHKNILNKNANNFYDRVLVKKDMPQGGTLSQADKELLQSWVDNNFAE